MGFRPLKCRRTSTICAVLPSSLDALLHGPFPIQTTGARHVSELPAMFEKYCFGTDFQDLLLACIIQKPEKFMHNVGTLNSAYFYGVERIA